jgi:hypothetical protein
MQLMRSSQLTVSLLSAPALCLPTLARPRSMINLSLCSPHYPAVSGLCLSVSNKSHPGTQGAPAVEVLPCVSADQSPLLAKNQTWELTADGQIQLADGDGIVTPAGPCAAPRRCCIDVPGYSRVSGVALHLWSCTNPCTTAPCPPPPVTQTIPSA